MTRFPVDSSLERLVRDAQSNFDRHLKPSLDLAQQHQDTIRRIEAQFEALRTSSVLQKAVQDVQALRDVWATGLGKAVAQHLELWRSLDRRTARLFYYRSREPIAQRGSIAPFADGSASGDAARYLQWCARG
jgi:hypothetical protein